MSAKNTKKINKKLCPCCGLQAAVARKICSGCNTPFAIKNSSKHYIIKDTTDNNANDKNKETEAAASSNSESPSSNGEDGRRRTVRVKRLKPQFYDSSQFQNNKGRKKKGDKSNGKTVSTTKQVKSVLTAQLKRKEPTRLKETDVNIYENLITPTKAEQLRVILQELNSKFRLTTWRV